jgi:carboxypeptidase C (cathepsin A)
LIQAFLDRFPHLRQNDLHLSSESYGGHYIPTLAKHIVQQNENTKGTSQWLNFKGIAVGNPYTDPYSGLPAMVDTFWGHQIISHISYEKYLSSCDVKSGDFISGDDSLEASYHRDLGFGNMHSCNSALNTVIQESGSSNPYALDYRICNRDGQLRASAAMQRNTFLKSLLDRREDSSLSRHLNINEYVPCTPDYASAYLNQLRVKNAIHVKADITWTECSDPVWEGYNKTDSREISTAPIYNFLIDSSHSLKILIFSGADDAVCATVGTQRWIWNLGYPNTKKMWSEYLYNDQLAGYHTTWYNTNLTFLTIHNAGHEVNTWNIIYIY